MSLTHEENFIFLGQCECLESDLYLHTLKAIICTVKRLKSFPLSIQSWPHSIYMYIYIYIYIHIYIYINIYIYIYIYIHMYTYIHTCIYYHGHTQYVYVYVYIYICVYTHTHSYAGRHKLMQHNTENSHRNIS